MGFTDPAQDSKMPSPQPDSLLQVETTCGTLLYELQIIWDEVGEADADRDKMLFELEQECLEVYRRKVDQANRCRAQLRRAIADSEAELAAICSAMGERPVHIRQTDQAVRSLKEELALIIPQVEEMRKRKTERKNQFIEILGQIQNLKNELNGSTEFVTHGTVDYEADLSLRKLEEYQRQLHSLKIEKSDRLQQIEEHLNTLESLCSVMGMDFNITVNEINPSLGNSEASKSISNETIQKLEMAIQKLRDVKIQRMQKLQDLATALLELWNLMDTPVEEQQRFQKVTSNIAATEHEITEPNILSVDLLSFVEAEVSRLEEFKLSKMKELVIKKRSELEEICRKTHLIPESDSCFEDTMDAIESGTVDAAMVLEQIEVQIARIKEEALGRKEVLEKVEKWLAACDEECWLEEYNRDENRYNAGKGTHLVLKRAEKARALVSKLPGMVETLASKTIQWENETGVEFLYDGIRLLSMLEEYTLLRQEKEQERQRLRDQKKLQGQLIAEQEALYGSKPSPSKPQSVKKGPRFSTGGANNRRLSVGGAVQQTPKRESFHSTKATPRPRTSKKPDKILQNDLQFNHRLNNGFAASSGARRGIDMADVAVKKQLSGALNAKEVEAELVRKPFSPISLKASSRANSVANIDDHGDSCLQKMIPTNDPLCGTPVKTVTALADEEIRTPKAMHIPMQTAMTPASVPISVLVKPVEAIHEEIEHSFEEKRLAFMMSNSQSTVQSLLIG